MFVLSYLFYLTQSVTDLESALTLPLSLTQVLHSQPDLRSAQCQRGNPARDVQPASPGDGQNLARCDLHGGGQHHGAEGRGCAECWFFAFIQWVFLRSWLHKIRLWFSLLVFTVFRRDNCTSYSLKFHKTLLCMALCRTLRINRSPLQSNHLEWCSKAFVNQQLALSVLHVSKQTLILMFIGVFNLLVCKSSITMLVYLCRV